MSRSAPPLRERGLTLEDYMAHQHALRTLQQSHAVWIVDDVLGLRYRARLQLRLAPARQLVLTDDSSEEVGAQTDDSHRTRGASSGPSAATSSSIVLPLVPECKVDVCTSAMNGDECGVRLTLPSTLSVVAEEADSGALKEVDAEASYFILPISATLNTSTTALAQAWAAVLRSLCQSRSAAPPHPHVDPTLAAPQDSKRTARDDSAARSGDVKTSTLMRGVTENSTKPLAARTAASVVPTRPSLTAQPATPAINNTTAAAAPQPTQPKLQSGAAASVPSNTARTSTTPAAAAQVRHINAIMHDKAVPFSQSSVKASAEAKSATVTAAAMRRLRQSEEPPPLHPALPVHGSLPHRANSPNSNCTESSRHKGDAGTVVQREESPGVGEVKEESRFHELTSALRNRTLQAAQLAEHLRSSLSPARRSPSQATPVSTATTVAAAPLLADEPPHELDPDRPPTMAHISSGLVPALRGFQPLPAIISSTSSDDDDEDGVVGGGEGGGGGGDRNTRQGGLLSGIAAVDAARGIGGGGGNTNGGSFANLADSPRPQAPRGGHVCNLGSLGPSCGDEEALRMYNEIHGSHSSCSSSTRSAKNHQNNTNGGSSGGDGNASSFPSSAYEGAEEGTAHQPVK